MDSPKNHRKENKEPEIWFYWVTILLPHMGTIQQQFVLSAWPFLSVPPRHSGRYQPPASPKESLEPPLGLTQHYLCKGWAEKAKGLCPNQTSWISVLFSNIILKSYFHCTCLQPWLLREPYLLLINTWVRSLPNCNKSEFDNLIFPREFPRC